MAKINDIILNKLKKYLELIRLNGIKVDSAYLFGSYACGNSNEYSDIDFAVFSEDFEGILAKDIDKILGLSRKVDSKISILTFNKSSIDSLFVQKEILEKGIRVI